MPKDNTKMAIKIGLIASIISALFSIPTIVSFRFYENLWFIIYTIIGILLSIVIAFSV